MCNGGTGGRLSKLIVEFAILVGVRGLVELSSDQGLACGPDGEQSREVDIVGNFEMLVGSYSSFCETVALIGNTGNSLFFEFDLAWSTIRPISYTCV